MPGTLFLSRHCHTNKIALPKTIDVYEKDISVVFNNNFSLPASQAGLQQTQQVAQSDFADKNIQIIYSGSNLVSCQTAGMVGETINAPMGENGHYTKTILLDSARYSSHGAIDLLGGRQAVLDVIEVSLRQHQNPYKTIRKLLNPFWRNNNAHLGVTAQDIINNTYAMLSKAKTTLMSGGDVLLVSGRGQSKIIQLVIGADGTPDISQYPHMEGLQDNEYLSFTLGDLK